MPIRWSQRFSIIHVVISVLCSHSNTVSSVPVSDTLEVSVDSDSSSVTPEQPPYKLMLTGDQPSPSQQSLPWQQLLILPPPQVMIVERMHSGARRFVTLDFEQPVLLTDVLIPASHDLISLCVDVWLNSEDTDVTRLVISSDIQTRNLVLTDLQPPPLCRYLKVCNKNVYFTTH